MKLVSIIIPVYNRGDLITETLDSIKAQTYKNWECIIVDDRSTDNSFQIVQDFSIRDSRIKAYKRPNSKIKGANSCRNFGLQNSSGDLIIWFDSDDLMTPDHLERKFNKIQEGKYDFVVSQTQNFQDDKFLSPYVYEKKKYGIRASDFILLKIHWYTYDVMLKRSIAKQIEWNEKMKSWQDYNYFCKMLLETSSGIYLDKVLTHRRIHKSSIQTSLTQSSEKFNKELLENRILTYEDIAESIDRYTRDELLYGMMNISFDLMKMRSRSKHIKYVQRIIKNDLGWIPFTYFRLALISVWFFQKGYFLLEKAKNR